MLKSSSQYFRQQSLFKFCLDAGMIMAKWFSVSTQVLMVESLECGSGHDSVLE